MAPTQTPGHDALTAMREMGVSRRSLTKTLGGGLIAGAALGGLGIARPEPAVARTRRRSLSGVLAAQGSTADFDPPFPDYLGGSTNWDFPPVGFAYTDYAGVLAEYLAEHDDIHLGTKVRGTVTERPLRDGRAELTVVLHTTNALSWATVYPGDAVCDALEEEHGGNCFASTPAHFGYHPAELVADRSLRPSLAASVYKWVITNSAPGAPLPDLGLYFYGDQEPWQEPLSYDFRDRANGTLREASGFPEGTPGTLKVVQVWINPDDPACDDGCVPIEIVDIQPRRHRRHGAQAASVDRGNGRTDNRQRSRQGAHRGNSKRRK